MINLMMNVRVCMWIIDEWVVVLYCIGVDIIFFEFKVSCRK